MNKDSSTLMLTSSENIAQPKSSLVTFSETGKPGVKIKTVFKELQVMSHILSNNK